MVWCAAEQGGWWGWWGYTGALEVSGWAVGEGAFFLPPHILARGSGSVENEGRTREMPSPTKECLLLEDLE